MAYATSLTPPSPGLSATLFLKASVEHYSPKEPENNNRGELLRNRLSKQIQFIKMESNLYCFCVCSTHTYTNVDLHVGPWTLTFIPINSYTKLESPVYNCLNQLILLCKY